MSLVKVKKGEEEEDNMIIKPEAVGSNVDTSNWPLLLKNWDQCKCYLQFLREHNGSSSSSSSDNNATWVGEIGRVEIWPRRW